MDEKAAPFELATFNPERDCGTTLSVKLRCPKGSGVESKFGGADFPALLPNSGGLGLPSLRGADVVLPVPKRALMEATLQALTSGDTVAERAASALGAIYAETGGSTAAGGGDTGEQVGELTGDQGLDLSQQRVHLFSVGDVATAVSHPGRTVMNLRHGYYPPPQYVHPRVDSIYDKSLAELGVFNRTRYLMPNKKLQDAVSKAVAEPHAMDKSTSGPPDSGACWKQCYPPVLPVCNIPVPGYNLTVDARTKREYSLQVADTSPNAALIVR